MFKWVRVVRRCDISQVLDLWNKDLTMAGTMIIFISKKVWGIWLMIKVIAVLWFRVRVRIRLVNIYIYIYKPSIMA